MEWIKVKDKLPKDGEIYDIIIFWPETNKQERLYCHIFKSKHAVVGWINYFQELPYYQNGLYEMSFGIDENLVTHYMPHIPMPPMPKLVWQRSTKTMPDIWITSTDDEYEIGKHLTKFSWRQIEK